jgi:DNA end-binding protein Ku
MAARAIGSGNISFGLVSIPIKLYTAASAESVSFNMLHAKCGGRLKQHLYCPVDDEVVERNATVRGYEFQKDRYVQFTDEELKKLESPRTGELELMEFVPESTVDLVYIEKTYYLGPDKGGERAYRLLSESMRRTQRVAVGKYWTRGKENVVLVRPYKNGLALHQVYYANEVRAFDDVETGGEFQFKDVEKDLADKLIEQLSRPAFDASKYRDEYATRVMTAVEQKAAGEDVAIAPEQPKAQIIDLLEALKRSVTDAREQKAAEAPAATGAAATDGEAAQSATPAPAAAPYPKRGPKKAEPKPEEAAAKKKRQAG